MLIDLLKTVQEIRAQVQAIQNDLSPITIQLMNAETHLVQELAREEARRPPPPKMGEIFDKNVVDMRQEYLLRISTGEVTPKIVVQTLIGSNGPGSFEALNKLKRGEKTRDEGFHYLLDSSVNGRTPRTQIIPFDAIPLEIIPNKIKVRNRVGWEEEACRRFLKWCQEYVSSNPPSSFGGGRRSSPRLVA